MFPNIGPTTLAPHPLAPSPIALPPDRERGNAPYLIGSIQPR